MRRHPRTRRSVFVRDAIELSRGLADDVSPKTVVKLALTQDTYLITALQRVRTMARRRRVPFVSPVLRRVQSMLFGIELSIDAELGEGVCFVHTHGIVVGGDARVGSRVRFYGGNTLGTVHDNGYPTIGDDVVIGAGARILGPIRIGARASIGANAVVLRDVPAGAVAVGVPARIIERDVIG